MNRREMLELLGLAVGAVVVIPAEALMQEIGVRTPSNKELVRSTFNRLRDEPPVQAEVRVEKGERNPPSLT
jgi:hypothetical protein